MNTKGWIALSVMTIALGIAWLINVMGVWQGVDWVWTLLLGMGGALILAMGGIDKVTLVVGPFLIACSITSVMRQTGHLKFDTEVPVLVIVLGILMFIATICPIPSARWLRELSDERTKP